MSKIKTIFLPLGILLTLLIAGCNCTNEAVSVFEVILDTPTGDLVVSSLNPTFEWHGSDTCEPDNFRIRIDENKQYGGMWIDEDLSGDLTSYTLTGASLQPGREYLWWMQARNEYDPDETGDRDGPRSQRGRFYTGPVCSGEPLVAPEIEFPSSLIGGEEMDNWITHSGPQKFKWSYSGGCLPISYDYQFATDSGFTDIILSGTTTEPYVMHVQESFPNCSSLFWRVAANDGSTTGPWSDVDQFHWVEDESCPQIQYVSDDAARIFVNLYHDVCNMTGYHSPATVLSRGCNQWPDYMVTGNAAIGGGDYGMYEYRVDLGSGPCPSTGLDSKKMSGNDHFHVLAPGTYCISITKDQTVGDQGGTQNLLGGTWTEPRTRDHVAGFTVELGPGVQDVFLDFGWDEYELPVLYIPIPENINCRVGPDTICDPLKIPLAGEVLPLLARDQTTEWKLTSYEGEQCFVYLTNELVNQVLAASETSAFALADLPFFDPPPPCPTPTPEPSQGGPQKAYSEFKSPATCPTNRCQWVDFGLAAAGYCTEK